MRARRPHHNGTRPFVARASRPQDTAEDCDVIMRLPGCDGARPHIRRGTDRCDPEGQAGCLPHKRPIAIVERASSLLMPSEPPLWSGLPACSCLRNHHCGAGFQPAHAFGTTIVERASSLLMPSEPPLWSGRPAREKTTVDEIPGIVILLQWVQLRTPFLHIARA